MDQVANEIRPLISIVIVTYNSADEIGNLLDSLPPGAPGHRLQILVADNGSTDDTAQVATAREDVTFVPTGGNLGYAGGLNALRDRIDPEAVAVAALNPDLTVRPGALDLLVAGLSDVVGVTVPAIEDADGVRFHSLRREPSLLGMLGEATLGASWPGRPAVLGDTLRRPDDYERVHDVDWASGAALVASRECWDAVGPWEESFFLYSEETDFMRRARQAGFRVRYLPGAAVMHIGGASGASPRLEALMSVNRVRDYAGQHGPLAATAFRGLSILQSVLRYPVKPGAREALPYLLGLRDRSELPHATRPGDEPEPSATIPPQDVTGSVIIPAHQEAKVIGRLLDALADGLAPGIDVIVACNGCTDGTEEVARAHGAAIGATVLEVPAASKQGALNEAERTTTALPRAYLDADIAVSGTAVTAVLAALSGPQARVARPPLTYVTDDADAVVRSFYRARSATASLMSAMWGAGFFAVSAAGRERWDAFPADVPDDLLVDSLFDDDEKMIVDSEPVRVWVPRRASALAATLKRVYRPQSAAPPAAESRERRSSGSTLREMVSRNARRGPLGVADTAVYTTLAAGARAALVADRLRGRTGRGAWERDSTTR